MLDRHSGGICSQDQVTSRAQLHVYWLRDPTVIFQVCAGADDFSDFNNYIMVSYISCLLLRLQEGDYQNLTEIWNKKVKGDSIVRDDPTKNWGERRGEQGKQVAQ